MSYKIEKEGFEMYGFKLGQMTNKGRIIGFDENDRQCGIVVECNSNSLVRMSMGITIVLEGCEDCKYEYVNKNLIEQPKISIRHEIWNTTLIVQTLHCEPFETISKDGFEISYGDSTAIGKHFVNLGYAKGKCNTDIYYFSNISDAHYFLNTLLELVEMVNNPVPVVDLNETQPTNLGKYLLYVNPDIVELADENDSTIYECRKVVSMSIIKSQLEQILVHLNVKCEVRI